MTWPSVRTIAAPARSGESRPSRVPCMPTVCARDVTPARNDYGQVLATLGVPALSVPSGPSPQAFLLRIRKYRPTPGDSPDASVDVVLVEFDCRHTAPFTKSDGANDAIASYRGRAVPVTAGSCQLSVVTPLWALCSRS